MREAVSARRLVGGLLLLALVAYAFGLPWLAEPGAADSDYRRAGLPPGPAHLMGTDALGHDLALRVTQALQLSLAVAAGAALVATAIGALVGAAAAAGGPWLDAALTRLTDAMLAVPHLLATVVVVALFRGSLVALVLALALTHWPPIARIVRAEAQKVMASGYVAATRVAGASPAQVVRHHVLPSVAGQAGLAVVVMIPHALWHESTLSFLGIGLPPERASLGTLISLARTDVLLGRWWAIAFPCAALILITAAVALLGPGRHLRDVTGHSGLVARLRGRTRARAEGVSQAGAGSAPAGAAQAAPSAGLAVDGLTAAGLGKNGLVVDGLAVELPASRGRTVRALDGVTVRVAPGRILAVVGESGAGKSTLGDAICGLLPRHARTAGALHREGPVGHVPQAAASAFTPTRRVRDQVLEALVVDDSDRSLSEVCAEVGLEPRLLDRYPHQLSGGQLRRAALVAALAAGPTVLVLDEPTAGLDPAAAHDILGVLRTLANDRGLGMVLITHDLATLAESGVADEVAVLRDGRVCEHGPAARVLDTPEHAHTRELLAAAGVLPDGEGCVPDGAGVRSGAEATSQQGVPAP